MKKSLPAEELDRMFDAGEDISEYIDHESTRSLNREIKRINLDVPSWMLNALDHEAERLNISRQAVVKTMLDGAIRNSPAARSYLPA
ncbi:MAG: BrnA antitoxin family protein [Deltaproteobacteria bacterium]|jgi:hypothetical protein|nr:BrnA antitoxin family protein [Deltaproteobacteria bacterium]